ncbi:unnamed protein product [Phyllotreta striolata]|uniref:Uncharacterized protein n=1 Tax=Phyllotreta striolata TaxID=444603 RepID=A0A9N9TQM1_PHYSR|nr:unnamed protein product [Phyllotreta striolata]
MRVKLTFLGTYDSLIKKPVSTNFVFFNINYRRNQSAREMNKAKQRPRPKTSPEGSTRSSASDTLLWKIHDRKYSYPLKDRVPSSLEVLTSRDSIKCNDPDYFGTFLGPTVDESILVGLRMLINLGFALPPCDEPQPTPLKKIKPAKKENFSDASSQTKSSKTKSETSQTAVSSMRSPAVDKPIGKSEFKRIVDYEKEVRKEPELSEEASPTPSPTPTPSSEVSSYINEESPEPEANVQDIKEEEEEVKEVVQEVVQENEEVGLKAVREIQNVAPKDIEEVAVEQKPEKETIIKTKESPTNLPEETMPIKQEKVKQEKVKQEKVKQEKVKQEKIKQEKPVEKKPAIEEKESVVIEEPPPNIVEDVTLDEITEEELLERSEKEILALISSEIISEQIEEETPPKEGRNDSKSRNIAVTSRQRRHNDVDESLRTSQKKSTPFHRPPAIVVASAKCAQDDQSMSPSDHSTLPEIPMKPQSSKATSGAESDGEAKRRSSSTTKRDSKGSRRSSEGSHKSTTGARRRDSSDSKRPSGESKRLSGDSKRASRDSKSGRSPSGIGKISEEAMKSAQTMTADNSSSEGSGYDSTEEKSSKIDKSSSTSSLQKQPASPKSKDSSTDTYLCACRIQTECPARITEDEQCSCPSNISPIVINCPFLKNQSTEKTKEERPALEEEKLQCDCYTSTSSTGYTSGSDSNGNMQRGDCASKGEVRYAITKITEYGRFTTFEVMKSTKKVPKFMPKGLEGVFVLKHKS